MWILKFSWDLKQTAVPGRHSNHLLTKIVHLLYFITCKIVLMMSPLSLHFSFYSCVPRSCTSIFLLTDFQVSQNTRAANPTEDLAVTNQSYFEHHIWILKPSECDVLMPLYEFLTFRQSN